MISFPNLLKAIDALNQPLLTLKGIGPKKSDIFAKRGISTLLDLLMFLPVRYEDRTRIVPIGEVLEGEGVLIRGRVVSGGEAGFPGGGKRLFRVILEDESGSVDLIWFHYRKPHMDRLLGQGSLIAAYGVPRSNRGRMQIVHPDAAPWKEEERERFLGIIPVYPQVEGVSSRKLRSLIREVLVRDRSSLTDPLPPEVLRGLELPDLGDAVRGIHLPESHHSLDRLNRGDTAAHRRLTFQALFEVMLNVSLRKNFRKERRAHPLTPPSDTLENLETLLPFQLTSHQLDAVREIVRDLAGPHPMNRLLQGDVGCGKTVVAAVAAFVAAANGFQVAVMAPTQVLARQHFVSFSSLAPKMGFRPVLLTGASKKGDRIKIGKEISGGLHNVIIGTHSLIQDSILFRNLGLVLIDEQHRFGVRQRVMLDQKGSNPHILIMTATPIPRTLAMAAFADLDISTIREYPKGRLPVVTRLVDEGGKREVFDEVKVRLRRGEQGIVICPLIEGSEEGDLKNVLDMHERLKKVFEPGVRVGLIHGRLSGEEKERVMERFQEGGIQLLVGTTVVEVGVHAPGATFMIIEHPERFGLCQLHQLRGRVGRGSRQGVCFLMTSRGLPEGSVSRLNILAESHDGFEIALKDLQLRGQGSSRG
jgi:ATP-dependent DNA helicase RecG